MNAPELTLLQALFAADAETAASAFAGAPSVDVPRAGKVMGAEALADLAKAWPGMFGVPPGTELTSRKRVAADGRAVSEVLVEVSGPQGEVRLPVAIMGELDEAGLLTHARVYYAEWWVTGQHGFRATPFARAADERVGRAEDMPDVNADYFAAVSAWDMDAVMRTFGSRAYIEFGPRQIDERERIGKLYETFFGNEVRLLFSTITDDGDTMVLEWTSGGPEPRESGLAAYARDADGRIGSIHMYDNFDPTTVPGLVPD
jgi:hypothetical protein